MLRVIGGIVAVALFAMAIYGAYVLVLKQTAGPTQTQGFAVQDFRFTDETGRKQLHILCDLRADAIYGLTYTPPDSVNVHVLQLERVQ